MSEFFPELRRAPLTCLPGVVGFRLDLTRQGSNRLEPLSLILMQRVHMP